MRRIQDIDTTGVEPTVHPVALPARFREDEVEASLSPEHVFGNTANRSDQYFHVPALPGMNRKMFNQAGSYLPKGAVR